MPRYARRALALPFLLIGASAVGEAAPAGGGITLEVTVGTDLAPDACGTATTLDAIVGEVVNFCYRVTNHGSVPLVYHSLADSAEGTLLTEHELAIAPGATAQYNRIRALTPTDAGERSVGWTARDQRADYTPAPRAGAFIDIASSPTATDLDPPGDASDPSGSGMVAVDLPFAFPFFGVMADRVCVGVDGAVLVESDRCILFPTPNGLGPLPSPGVGQAILPLWDDFAGKESFCGDDCVALWGTVYAETLGTAPNRQFVVEWYNLRHGQGTANDDRATFELVLDEATGRLSFEYADVQYTAYGNQYGAPDICNDGICASIGLQQNDGWADSYSYLEASIIDDSAIDWIPTSPTTYEATANVTLTVGAPVVSAPSTLTASAAAGASTAATLTVVNGGDHALDWTLDQGAGAAQPEGAGVPAYVVRMLIADFPTMDNTLLGFDAADPAANAPVGPVSRIYDSGTFADDDFSKAYFLAGWHTVGATNIYTTEVLETVDTTTAEITRIGDTGVGPWETIQGMAWDPTTSNLYAMVAAIDSSGTTLATIDRYTAEVTRLMPVTGIDLPVLVGLAVDSTGRMYSIEQNSMTLVEVDKSTGALTTIGPIGDESLLLLSGPLAFDRATDVLYMTGATADLLGAVYVVDRDTGHASFAGTIGEDQQLASALAIATAGGPCVGAAPAPWLTFSPASGSVAPGASAAIDVGFDASALAEGTYEADLCLRSNDPYRHTSPVHVTFEVGAVSDTIFASGFDAP